MICIIDYEMGNIGSIRNILNKLNINYQYEPLIKIKEKQPDAIFLTFASETLVGPFLKQVKELGLEVDVLGTVGAENGLSGHTDYAEVTLFYTYPKITKEQLDLLEKFELKYDVEPQVPAYANAYDAANIVITALNSGASNPDEIRNYFDNNKFKSVTFGTLKFDEKGYVSVDSVDYIIKTVKDGKFIEIKQGPYRGEKDKRFIE